MNFSTEFLVVITMLCTGCAVFCAIWARLALRVAAKSEEWVQHAWQELEKIARERSEKSQLAALQVEVTDLADAYASLLDGHKRLRSRIGMREVRARKKNGADPEQLNADLNDPAAKAAYKQAFRTQMKEKGML